MMSPGHSGTRCLLVAAVASFGGLWDPASAQEPAPVDSVAAAVHLDFRDAELQTVVAALAELAGVTLVYSGLPSEKVTLRSAGPVSRAQILSMLRAVARSAGLDVEESDDMIEVIAPHRRNPERARQSDAGDHSPEEIRLFVQRLRHARAEHLAHTIRELFGLGGGGGPAASVQRRPLSAELRSDRIAPAVPPTGGQRAESSAPEGRALQAALGGAVQVIADGPNNALIIRATAGDYAVIRDAVEELDARPLQVLIEVLIAEVRRDRQLQVGVDVSVPDRATGRLGGAQIGGELVGRSAGDLAIRVLGLGNLGADVALRALASSSDITILSRPVILAQNNQPARILVGSQRPFIQLFRALPTDAAVRDQIVQYRDVGTQLTIHPTINPDGYVTLSVLQEVSTATTETQFGAPVISTREAETQLLVRDGHTVIIGGLIDRERELGVTGIPVLKDIPLIGMLFRSSQRRTDVTELFLFLTPHVLWTDDDTDEATRELRDATRRLRRELSDPIPLIPGRNRAPHDNNPHPEPDDK